MGPFKNYEDKMRWAGGPKNLLFLYKISLKDIYVEVKKF